MSALLAALAKRLDVLVHLDFETYWDKDYTLKKMTTEAYVRDPRFEAIGIGVRFGGRPTVWLEEWEFREWAARVDWARVALCANHNQFDGFILSHHYGVRPGFMLCTMSMGRAVHGEGGLDKLAMRYGLGKKGDELLKTQGKRRRQFSPEEWRAFGGYCINDVDMMAGLFPLLSAQLPPEELWLIDSTIRMFTEPVFIADRAVLQKALQEEKAKKRAVLEGVARNAGVKVPPGATEAQALEAARAVLSSNDQFAALLRTMGEEPPTKAGKKGQIFAFAKTDPGMQALIEHERDDLRAIAEARLEIKSTIVETRTERIIGISARGAVPFYLKYCGAHTHRWSGGDKMNPQNFNRGGVLRDAILAPAGHVLVVADSGQIEARTVAWLARQESLLATFRRNDALGEAGDFYSDEGAHFFGKKLSKKETPQERQISKALLLGLGFQMGWPKCAGELLKGMLGTPPVQFTLQHATQFRVSLAEFEERQHGKVTCGDVVRDMAARGARIPLAELMVHSAVTAHLVNMYRLTNRRIVGLWNAMGDALRMMAPSEGTEVRGKFGPLTFLRHAMRKPTGMVLHYPGLKRTTDGFTYLGGKSGREFTHIYGGLVTENAVQSIARDIVAEQALWVRARGYRIGTTTHDEIVAVVPEDQGEECLAYMLERMRIPPAWCADLPLNATGAIARSYGEAK